MGIIRVLLSVSVVITHTGLLWGYNIANGMVAVQIFYIFSGFYMFLILSNRYKSIGNFFKSRALRLYPIYFCITFLTFCLMCLWFLFGGSSMFSGFADIWRVASLPTRFFAIVANSCLFFQDTFLFLAVNPHTGGLYFTSNSLQEPMPLHKLLLVPQAWSLGVELTFYLFAPFLVKRKTITLVLIAGASISLRLILAGMGFDKDPWSYRFFPFELALFLFGGIGYRIYERIKHSKKTSIFAPFVTILTLSSLFAFQFLHIKGNYILLYYMAIALAVPFVFHMTKDSFLDRKIGDLSYPIYISHILVAIIFLAFIQRCTSLSINKDILCIPIIMISVFISLVMNKYIQNSIDIFRQTRLCK